jgi:FlaG/FlaF family flagellin (archaellin)
MKGISDVIAVLLMLIITIGLAGLAYSYISGVFTARTAVVLSIDAAASSCAVNGGPVTVFVRNDGAQEARSVTLSMTGPNAGACNPIPSIAPGNYTSTTCGRTGSAAGYYSIVASVSGSTARGQVYCSS